MSEVRDFGPIAARIVKMLSKSRRMTSVQLKEYFDKLDADEVERKRKAFEDMKKDPRTYRR